MHSHCLAHANAVLVPPPANTAQGSHRASAVAVLLQLFLLPPIQAHTPQRAPQCGFRPCPGSWPPCHQPMSDPRRCLPHGCSNTQAQQQHQPGVKLQQHATAYHMRCMASAAGKTLLQTAATRPRLLHSCCRPLPLRIYTCSPVWLLLPSIPPARPPQLDVGCVLITYPTAQQPSARHWDDSVLQTRPPPKLPLRARSTTCPFCSWHHCMCHNLTTLMLS
jgi:hypothetical protein